MLTTAVRTRLLDGFDDPDFGPEQWEALLARTKTEIVYVTWPFQRAWWETFPRGDLLLVVAERDGEVVALAPLYTQSGMVYFVGSSFEFDCLDFVGDISDPAILEAILDTARAHVPDFQGFEFQFVPDRSETARYLEAAAARLGLSCSEGWELPAFALDMAGRPEIALAATRKKSAMAAERFFLRGGKLEVHRLRDGRAILPELEPFFAQHIDRWAATAAQSRFRKPSQRALYENLTRFAADTGWLRFTRVDWNARPVAFHYGFCYRGRYYWDTPTFAVDLARRSPGQVLLRHLLLDAIEERAHTFDLGTAEFAFKLRVATEVNPVREWALYRRSRTRTS